MIMTVLIAAAVGTTLPCIAVWVSEARKRAASRC
jgi:hypothetical protein